MAPGSRPVDSAARGGPWLRKATRACPELGAPTAASGEAPSGPVGCEPGRRAVRPTLAAGRRPDRATGAPRAADDGSPGAKERPSERRTARSPTPGVAVTRPRGGVADVIGDHGTFGGGTDAALLKIAP